MMLLTLGFVASACLLTTPAQANTFDAWQYVQGVNDSGAQWGDFDGDGDLDLVVCGTDVFSTRSTRTYENVSGTLTWRQNLVGIDGAGSGCLAWGDYDGDGDLDLALAGESGSGPTTRIYRNDGTGILAWDTAQILTGVMNASVAWGDHDGDGDLDLLVMGNDGITQVTTVYENDPPGSLAPDPSLGLTGLASGSADWADWDGDGDLDLLLTGYRTSQRLTIFYKNDGYGLVNDGTHGLPGIALSDAAWGDYDTDGDLDLAITGETQGGTKMARVYRNDSAGNLTQIVDVMSITQSSCAWGDYDNDGYQDVAFSGTTGTSYHSAIYRYTDTTFTAMFSLRYALGFGELGRCGSGRRSRFPDHRNGRGWFNCLSLERTLRKSRRYHQHPTHNPHEPQRFPLQAVRSAGIDLPAPLLGHRHGRRDGNRRAVLLPPGRHLPRRNRPGFRYLRHANDGQHRTDNPGGHPDRSRDSWTGVLLERPVHRCGVAGLCLGSGRDM